MIYFSDNILRLINEEKTKKEKTKKTFLLSILQTTTCNHQTTLFGDSRFTSELTRTYKSKSP